MSARLDRSVNALSDAQLRVIDRTLSRGMWIIVFGAVVFSVLTVTPLVAAHTPEGPWRLSAPLLPIVVDTAVIIVTRVDAALARLGAAREHIGRWPAVLRWMTGLMTLALNVTGSALHRDWVGVGVHAVAPLLLIVTAEAGQAYRRAVARVLEAREATAREHAEQEAREAAERAAQARAERQAERDRQDRLERERAERERAERQAERERAAKLEEQRLELQARLERERLELERERDRAARERERQERERQERAEQAARERETREAQERAARAAADQAARERAEREREREREERERAERERMDKERQQREALRAWLLGLPNADGRLPEEAARDLVLKAAAADLPTRAAARITGWSLGWVAARYQEIRDRQESLPALEAA